MLINYYHYIPDGGVSTDELHSDIDSPYTGNT